MGIRRIVGVAAAAFVWTVVAVVGVAATDDLCVTVGIDRVGHGAVEDLKAAAGAVWWLELGDELLLCGGASLTAAVRDQGFEPIRELEFRSPGELVLVRGRPGDGPDLADEALARCAHLAVVPLEEAAGLAVDGGELGRGVAAARPVVADTVVLRQAANAPPSAWPGLGRVAGELVAEVDPARWYADVVALASFNRFSLTDGIFDAESWIEAQLRAMPGMVVTTPGFYMGGREVHNVIGTLAGSVRPDHWLIVGGHYDSTSEDPVTAAPGAEDNASGCAGVLEMARIFAGHPPASTVIFACYVGEEQGLLGSYDHVGDLLAAGDADKVATMLDLDMIAYSSDADLDCLLETEDFCDFLLPLYSAAAAEFSSLRILTSTWAFGSDHVPYLQQGIPALLTIENEWASYPYYHSTNDLPQYLSQDMAGGILRMNVGALAWMDVYGTGLVFADGFESGALDRWTIEP